MLGGRGGEGRGVQWFRGEHIIDSTTHAAAYRLGMHAFPGAISHFHPKGTDCGCHIFCLVELGQSLLKSLVRSTSPHSLYKRGKIPSLF